MDRPASVRPVKEEPMSVFTRDEIAYLRSGRLGRLATVGRGGTPHVTPVGFSYNAELDAIDVGGHDMAITKKFRDVTRSGRAALVVDDVRPPWRPRGIEVRGRAGAVGGSRPLIRIHPERIVSWGIDTDGYRRHSRSVGAAR
jgi:pyridoxamine 5'-phosphate oxidase family protein